MADVDWTDNLVTLSSSSISYIEPANLSRYQDVFIKSESGATCGFNRSHLSALSSICHGIFKDLYQCPLANSDEAIHISTNLTSRELEMVSDFFLRGSLPTLADNFGINFDTQAVFEAFGLRLQDFQYMKEEDGQQSLSGEPISFMTDFNPEESVQPGEESDLWNELPSQVPKEEPKAKRARRHVIDPVSLATDFKTGDGFVSSKKARDLHQHKDESDSDYEPPQQVPKKNQKSKSTKRSTSKPIVIEQPKRSFRAKPIVNIPETPEELFSFPQTGDRDLSLAFQCQRCVRGFNRLMDYRQHFCRHELGKEDLSKAYVCIKCMDFTSSLPISKQHQHWTKECYVKRFDDASSIITYFCAFCEVSFASSKGLENHLEEKHPTERKQLSRPQFECYACGKGFKCKRALAKHMVDEGPFHKCQCTHCRMEFESWTDLTMHISKVHDNKMQYMCGMCGVNVFDSDKQRQDHKQFCKLQPAVEKVRNCGEGKVVCTICGMEVGVSHHKINKHLKEYHSDFGLKCELCPLMFYNEATLNKHMLNIHVNATRFSCDMCEKAFPTMPRLKLHKDVSHPESGKKQEYKCDKCPAAYSHKGSLRTHYLAKHGDKPFVRKTRVCEVCGDTIGEDWYQNHMDTWHKVGHLPCEICGKMLASEKTLKRHLYLHKLVDITCEHCGEKFTKKAFYKRHMISKHGPEDKKPYYCSQCNKGFMSSQPYSTHMNGHTGKKPHKCKFCDRCFADSNNCRKHMKQAHPEYRLQRDEKLIVK